MAGLYDFKDSTDVNRILVRLKRLEGYIPQLRGGKWQPADINPASSSSPHCVMLGTEIVPVDDAEYEPREYAHHGHFWYIRDVEGHWLNCTPDHRLYDAEGYPKQAQDFETGDIIVHRSGNFAIAESNEAAILGGTKVEIIMKRVHIYWANGFLSHNVKIQIGSR